MCSQHMAPDLKRNQDMEETLTTGFVFHTAKFKISSFYTDAFEQDSSHHSFFKGPSHSLSLSFSWLNMSSQRTHAKIEMMDGLKAA